MTRQPRSSVGVVRPPSWTVSQADPLLRSAVYIIDGSCGLCRRSTARAQRMFPGTFAVLPYWDIDLDAFGLSLEACAHSGHLLVPAGERVVVMPGSQSWAGLLLLQRSPWRLLGRAMTRRPLRTISERVYRLIADHRSVTGACTLDERHLSA